MTFIEFLLPIGSVLGGFVAGIFSRRYGNALISVLRALLRNPLKDSVIEITGTGRNRTAHVI